MFHSKHPGSPNGTRLENLPGTAPAVEARHGALEIKLPPIRRDLSVRQPQVTEPAVSSRRSVQSP